jgi:NAD(P)-dependent dehydrogenase (short-subunit alcohol dehydrogenase family)
MPNLIVSLSILAAGIAANAFLFLAASALGLFSESVVARSTGTPLTLVPVIAATALGGLAGLVGRMILVGVIRNRRRARRTFIALLGVVTLVSFGSPVVGLAGAGLAEVLLLNLMHTLAALAAGFAGEWLVRPLWKFGLQAYRARIVTPPVAVVTGATSGIGAEVARSLADRGYRVLGVGRSEQRAREVEAGRPNLTIISSDLSLMRNVRRIAGRLNELSGSSGIGLLVHCAGTLLPASQRNAEGLDTNFATSFLSRFALSEGLRLAHSCRVVNVAAAEDCTVPASLLKPLARPGDIGQGMRSHGQAQLANDLWTAALARSGISAFGYGPGAVDTRIRRELPPWMVTFLRPVFAVDTRSPSDAAKDIVRLLLDESLPSSGFASRDGLFEHHSFIRDPRRQDELLNLARSLVANARESGPDASSQ